MKSQTEFSPSTRSWLPVAMSSLVIALGLSVLLGWHLHIPRLTQWSITPMAYNTAISLLLLGLALLAIHWGRSRFSAVLAILGGLPSLLSLVEYVGGISLGIDQVLMKSGYSLAYRGRIAPNTALALVTLSAALLGIARGSAFRWGSLGSPLLAAVGLGISSVAVAGYATGFATYGWGKLVPMAVTTSVGLTLLSLAVLGLLWRASKNSGECFPSWLYIAVTAAATVMTVSVWQALESEEYTRIEDAVSGQLKIVQISLFNDMESRIAPLGRFARRCERNGVPDQQQWDFENGLLMKDLRGFEEIAWADPTGHIRWVYPGETHRALLGADLSSDLIRHRALDMARDSHRTFVTRTIQLLAGGEGIQAYVPIYRTSVFQGFIVAEFRFQDLFPQIVDTTLTPGYAIAIYDGDRRIYFHAPPDKQRGRAWQQQASLQVANARWTLQLWPTPSALAAAESTASNIVLASGLLLSGLLGLAVYLAQAARAKTRLTERAREALEEEVAERNRAEAARQESEAAFRALADIVPQMVWICTPEGLNIYFNQRWVDYTGLSLVESYGMGWNTPFHPDDKQAAWNAWNHAIATGETYQIESRLRAADGTYRWFLMRGVPMRDGSGRIAKWFGTCTEIHDLKQAAEKLRNLNEQLGQASVYNRSLIEASLDPLVTIAPDGSITDVNQATEQATGLLRQTLIGTDFSDYFTDPERARQGYQQVFREGSVQNYELELHGRDGRTIPVLYNASVYRDDSGNVEGVFAAARDITERKRAEEKIKELNSSLEQRVAERTADLLAVNQELEAFNYSVSHDLRAPLRHIDGYSKILLAEHGAGLPDAGRRCVNRIRDGAQRMGRMVDELLDLSRISRREPSRQLTGLGTLVAEVVEELAPEMQGRQIDWRIGDLPFADCDPVLMRQVFANLLANAVKFTRGRRPAVIEVGQTLADGQAVLFVRDNGVGFSMKYADKLFGVFQRLHRREDFEGTGVGLVTVQRIIHKHHGRIWAEAELDNGAAFYFTLDPPGPLRLEESSAEPTTALAGDR